MNALHRSKFQLLFWGILFAAPLVILFLSSGKQKETKLASNTKSPDRIFLVTLDTTRADHIPLYGYPFATAPFLSKLEESRRRRSSGPPLALASGVTRLAFYSHDTFGLGHLSRCLKLAGSLLPKWCAVTPGVA